MRSEALRPALRSMPPRDLPGGGLVEGLRADGNLVPAFRDHAPAMVTAMSTGFGAGFHAAPGKAVDASAYDGWTGRWSRLFIPAALAAAAVEPGSRVLDVSTG